MRKDVPTEEDGHLGRLQWFGNPEGNLQSVVCWGRRLWHEGQRRIPLRLNIRITGRLTINSKRFVRGRAKLPTVLCRMA